MRDVRTSDAPDAHWAPEAAIVERRDAVVRRIADRARRGAALFA